MKTYIKAISYYTAENVQTNADIIKDFPEWSEKKISVKIGIEKRFVAAKQQTAGDLAFAAAERLFEEHGIDKQSIDVLMLCTQSPDYFLPTTACILQDRLGLPTHILAFDYNLGCSGFVNGLAIAKGLIVGGMAKNVLLLTAETYHKYIHSKDRGNRSLFSDAAAATLVSDEGFAEIQESCFGTDGSGYKNLIVEAGAHRMPEKQGIELDPENEILQSPDYLFMDGPKIFNFTLEAVPLLVKQVLKKNKLQQEEIDLFVFHQANKHMLTFIRDAIGIPEEKFYMCLANFGNTVSSTIPIALYHAMKDNSMQANMNVLLAGFGVGYSWGGLTLKIKSQESGVKGQKR